MKIIFSQRCLEYEVLGHPESPQRIRLAYNFLKEKGFEFIEPRPCSEEDIILAHSRSLLEKVKNNQIFDPDTPNILDIFKYACLSVGSAILAQEICLTENSKVLSLMRPPGHHAGYEQLGGFCYFNNIAIAIKKALQKVNKAVILDLDCHHGNGTQEIFLGNKNILYVSLHQVPLYPGTGLRSEKNCLNYPLPPGTQEEEYLKTLRQALERIKEFKPEIIGISLGLDTYEKDPLANLKLKFSSYHKIGFLINRLEIPSFAVLEGGYSADLGRCIYEFILGWEDKKVDF
ncbi:MAG: histone deacetylase [Candidatus Omnitrophica bacterium]|nr:histone deacetylase [Candidatus Omnitrophota bacterium]